MMERWGDKEAREEEGGEGKLRGGARERERVKIILHSASPSRSTPNISVV